MKNILVRADSSSVIGIGHIMRTLVLVQQSYANDKVTFACQNLAGNINEKVILQGYEVKILRSNDIKELAAILNTLNIDVLIIDHYNIDYDFEKQIKLQYPKIQLLSFDDIYEKHYCDILLNHNIYAQEIKYKDLVPKDCEIRCGKEYMLLRNEFKNEKNNPSSKLKDYVVIAMGGSDSQNLSSKIVKILTSYPKLHIKVVTTKANKHLEELIIYSQIFNTVEIIVESNEIARLFNNASFAIVTASSVASEVIYLDVPFIAIKIAENQRMMYEYLKENDYNVLDKYNESTLKQFINQLIQQ